jgi:hypothetical protein
MDNNTMNSNIYINTPLSSSQHNINNNKSNSKSNSINRINNPQISSQLWDQNLQSICDESEKNLERFNEIQFKRPSHNASSNPSISKQFGKPQNLLSDNSKQRSSSESRAHRSSSGNENNSNYNHNNNIQLFTNIATPTTTSSNVIFGSSSSSMYSSSQPEQPSIEKKIDFLMRRTKMLDEKLKKSDKEREESNLGFQQQKELTLSLQQQLLDINKSDKKLIKDLREQVAKLTTKVETMSITPNHQTELENIDEKQINLSMSEDTLLGRLQIQVR